MSKGKNKITTHTDNPPVCDICCDKFNKTNRKLVTCPFCDKSCCLTCQKSYITTTTQDPHCMHCKIRWNHTFIRTTFPATWLNKEYKSIREKLLFDQEIAKIPDTQRFCEVATKRTNLLATYNHLTDSLKNLREELVSLKKSYEDCSQEIWMLNDTDGAENKIEALKQRAHELYQRLRHLDNKMEKINDDIRNCTDEMRALTAHIEGNALSKKEDLFQFHCPQQKCKGFVGSNWKCGLCFSRICPDCHEKKQDDEMQQVHTCDKDTKASVAMLKSDTKPCPRCGSLIHKISGCDQMWCTQCTTAFSWNTGQPEQTVHNPHYFEWLRLRNNQHGERQPRTRNDDNGNGNINRICTEPYVDESATFVIVQRIREKVPDVATRNVLLNLVRLLIHISEVEIPNSIPPHFKTIPHDPNRELRIRYMLNEIDVNEFRSILVKREKDRVKREESSQILQMFFEVADDLVRQFLDTSVRGTQTSKVNDDGLSLSEFFNTIEQLRTYTNQSLGNVARLYSSKGKYITSDFANIIVTEPEKKKENEKDDTLDKNQ